MLATRVNIARIFSALARGVTASTRVAFSRRRSRAARGVDLCWHIAQRHQRAVPRTRCEQRIDASVDWRRARIIIAR